MCLCQFVFASEGDEDEEDDGGGDDADTEPGSIMQIRNDIAGGERIRGILSVITLSVERERESSVHD